MTIEIRRFPTNSKFNDLLKIAENYEAAIERRGRWATDPEFLASIWKQHGSFFVRKGQNFIMLRKLGDVYVASHFAPSTMKGGVKLLKEIKASGLPIVFAVPEDLAKNLDSLGWIRLPKWAMKLLHKNGVPEEKVVLIPKGFIKKAWELFRNRDYYNHLDMDAEEPTEVINFRRKRPRKKPKTYCSYATGEVKNNPFRVLKQLL